MDRANINWNYISDAIEYYKNLGYKYIEVPWIVSKDLVKTTIPQHTNEDCIFSIAKSTESLVGSAEQSFLSMLYHEQISPGMYVACSPCFRNEMEDELHHKTFMKVELFITPYSYKAYERVINDAHRFFENHLANFKLVLEKTVTPIGIDIELNGIEIGSYGSREVEIDSQKYSWIYGTGVAEPRLSTAIRKS